MKKTVKKVIVSSALMIALTGCGNEERKSFYDNGQIKTMGFYDAEGKRQDAFKMYAEDGSILEDTIYKDNKIVSGFKTIIEPFKICNKTLKNYTVNYKNTYVKGELKKNLIINDKTKDILNNLNTKDFLDYLKCNKSSQEIINFAYETGLIEYGKAVFSNNYEKTIAIFEILANEGDARSQYILGSILLNENPNFSDYEGSIKWWELAAKQGHIDAQYKLQGRSNRESLELAAKQGNAAAMFELGSKADTDLNKIKWYKLASSNGHGYASFRIGLKYYYGEGVEKNLNEAIKWFKLGADQDYHLNFYWLGRLSEDGEGLKKNLDEAFKLYKIAADKGNGSAMCAVGKFYHKGLGEVVEKNLNEALKFYTSSTAMGIECKELDELCNENESLCNKFFDISVKGQNEIVTNNISNSKIQTNDKIEEINKSAKIEEKSSFSIDDLVLNITDAKGREKLFKLDLNFDTRNKNTFELLNSNKDNITNIIIETTFNYTAEKLNQESGKNEFLEEIKSKVIKNILNNDDTGLSKIEAKKFIIK